MAIPKNKKTRPDWTLVKMMTCFAIERYEFLEAHLEHSAAPKKIRKKIRKALDLFFQVNQYAIKKQKKR